VDGGEGVAYETLAPPRIFLEGSAFAPALISLESNARVAS
jgi:hypothetical protein